jgi:outer membrane murein-binding lipoprotein Lpp
MKTTLKIAIAIVVFSILMAMGISYVFKKDSIEPSADQNKIDSLAVKVDSLKHQADSLSNQNDTLKKK